MAQERRVEANDNKLSKVLEKCSSPYQLRIAIDNNGYYRSRRCIKKIKDKVERLIEDSISPYDIELYNEILDEVDEKVISIRAQIELAIDQKVEERAQRALLRGKEKVSRHVYIEENSGIKIEIDTDKITSNAAELVFKQLFLETYNRLNGSPSAMSEFLGCSVRAVSHWKRKYTNSVLKQ